MKTDQELYSNHQQAKTQIDHTEYPKTLKNKSDSSLRYIMKDCHDAMTAFPDGHKSDYYADEINYCCTELRRRSDARMKRSRKR